MAKRTFHAGATSQTVDVFIQDSSSSAGAGLGSLVFNTSGLTCYYRKGATGTPTAVTLATQTVGGAWSSGGFVELDNTHMRGAYRFDIPDTVLASTPFATLYFYGASNMAPVMCELEITSVDFFDAVRMGLTALPNVASGSAGAIPTTGTGANQIAVDGAGSVSAAVVGDKTGYALTSGERTSIADALLNRNLATGTDTGSDTVRTVRQAFRILRNRVNTQTGIVYREDDATSDWTFTATGDASAVPIIEVNPNGP